MNIPPEMLAQVLRQMSAPNEPPQENMQVAQVPQQFGVYNGQTGALISAHSTREAAARASHKIFLENGGHVYVPVRRIPLGPAPK